MVEKRQPFVRASSLAWEEAGPGIHRQVTAYDDAVMSVMVKFEQGAVGVLHHHPHVQVTFVRTGTFDVTIGGTVERLREGDFFFVSSGVSHGVTAIEAGTLIDFFSPMRSDFLPNGR